MAVLLSSAQRRLAMAVLIFALPMAFLRMPQVRRRNLMCSRTARGAKGFGNADQAPDQSDDEEELSKEWEDVMYQMHMENDLAMGDNLRELIIGQEEGLSAMVWLVGTNHVSAKAAEVAAAVVRHTEPSALVLELCRERVDFLIRGNSHREAVQKSFMAPDQPEAMRRAFARYGDEDRKSFAAFMEANTTEKLLILGDLKSSTTSSQLAHDEDVAKPELVEPRDRNLAMNIFSAFLLGHRRIVAVLGAEHLDGVERNLEMLTGRFWKVLEDEGSFAKAASTFGRQIWDSLSTGLYISRSGCKALQVRQEKLKMKVPATLYRKRRELSESKRERLEIKLSELCNGDKICNSLGKRAVEPSDWKALSTWWRSVKRAPVARRKAKGPPSKR